MRRDAQKMDERPSDGLVVAVCAIRLDIVELECSLKSAMRGKSCNNMINFVEKFILAAVTVSLL